MASPSESGPLSALLNVIDQTTIMVMVVLGGIIGFARAIWGIRQKDLDRMSATETKVASMFDRLTTHQSDITELRAHLKQYQEALAEKPDREEIFRRLDALPGQVSMFLDRRRD